jgi:hypothetical protein
MLRGDGGGTAKVNIIADRDRASDREPDGVRAAPARRTSARPDDCARTLCADRAFRKHLRRLLTHTARPYYSAINTGKEVVG